MYVCVCVCLIWRTWLDPRKSWVLMKEKAPGSSLKTNFDHRSAFLQQNSSQNVSWTWKQWPVRLGNYGAPQMVLRFAILRITWFYLSSRIKVMLIESFNPNHGILTSIWWFFKSMIRTSLLAISISKGHLFGSKSTTYQSNSWQGRCREYLWYGRHCLSFYRCSR